MKKLFVYIFILTIFSSTVIAQISWQLTGYPSSAPVNKINTASEGLVIAASDGDGVLVSKDSGDTWSTRNTGLTDFAVKSIGSKDDSILFAGVNNRIVFVSTDTGHSWTPYNMNGTGNIISSFFTMPDGSIYAGQLGDGIFRSADNGQSWQEVGLCCAGVLSIYANSGGVIFAGTNAGGVSRSTDGGTAWNYVNTGLSNLKIKALAVNSSDALFAGTDGGVFRSANNGDNWTEVNYGLTNLSITDICIKHNGHIFVSTAAGGIFLSKDDGDNWTPVNTGLTSMDISCLAMDTTGFIYAGSPAGILFRSLIPYSHINNPVQAHITKLQQNFPNPFSSSTTLKFYISKPSNVTLKIYDITGRVVETLVNKRLSEGLHYEIWDASKKHIGAYVCELRSNDGISRIIINFVK